MPRSGMLAIATIAVAAVLSTSAPAFAEFGALAYDETTGKYGLSFNEPDQKKAEEVAKKDCTTCKIIFQTKPRECGAIAKAESGTAWGAAKRPSADAAKLAALESCQKRTKEQCVVRANECNK